MVRRCKRKKFEGLRDLLTVRSSLGHSASLQIHCLDQHGTIRFHEVCQIFSPGFMLDALAARLEYFEFVFVVAAEVIVERFAADCTRNGLVSVLTRSEEHTS